MPSVVIIHAAEDALPARALAEKLRAAKLTPVLEKTGEDLHEAMRDASVSIALWSPRSVDQASVAEDAGFAKGKSKLFHARMQNAAPPSQFRNEQSFDLTGWRGEDDFEGWRELAKAVTSKAGVGPLPPPAPRLSSGFFQPGRPTEGAPPPAPGAQRQQPRAQQPPPRAAAPRSAPQSAPRVATPRTSPAAPERSGGGMMMIVIAVIAVLVVGGGGYWFMTQSNGGQASAAWEEIARNDAAALRAFLAGNPGQYRAEAQAALATLEEQSYDAARDADTIESFEAFVAEFPQSSHALAARGRMAELRAAPETAAEEALPIDPLTGLPVDPNAPAPDPDLLPPGTSPEPDSGGGPAALTPPAPEPENPEEPDSAPN